MPGPFLGGPEWAPWHVVVPEPEDARRAVAEVAALGADFVKVHDVVPWESFVALGEAARAHELDLFGHVPRGLDPVAAIEAEGESVWRQRHGDEASQESGRK